MASLPFIFGATASGSVFTARATKGAAGSTTQEKGFVDWLLGNLTKEDQFYETDPILQKVEGKSGTTGSNGRRVGTIAIQSKKKDGGNGGAFGGLFAKKE